VTVSHGSVRSRESPTGDGVEGEIDAVDPDARRAERRKLF